MALPTDDPSKQAETPNVAAASGSSKTVPVLAGDDPLESKEKTDKIDGKSQDTQDSTESKNGDAVSKVTSPGAGKAPETSKLGAKKSSEGGAPAASKLSKPSVTANEASKASVSIQASKSSGGSKVDG